MAKSDVLVRMMADTKNYDANIAQARRALDKFKKDNLSMGGILKQTSSSIIGMAAQYASIGAAIGAVGAAFRDNIATARNFEKSMSQLSSLTGMVGSDLDKLKEYAIELGSTTTLSASEVADAFKMIGSQQPQLLESGEALKKVTKYAITLSEAAGIDLATAAQTLSTSINQMGGDSENAARFVNVLAAASQKGAGDIAWLGEAVTKSGTTARAVGTSYEELVANLEQLAKAGFDASTAGTALRSIIMNLEKQANNNFKPSVVGLTQAFENLGKANLDIVGYQEIAGKMFASQAKALADASAEAKDMTVAITGTNTAEEQAKTNTDNLDGSLKSLASAWEGLNLHINSSNGFLRDAVDWLKDVVTATDNAYQRFERFYNKFGWMLNPSKEGARDSFVEQAAAKWGNAEEVKPASQSPAPAAATPAPLPVVPSGGGGKKGSGNTNGTSVLEKQTGYFEKAMAKANILAGTLKPEEILGPSDAWEKYKDAITGCSDSINDFSSATARWTENFDPYAEKMEKMEKLAKQQQIAFNLAAQSAQNFGSALSSIDDPGAKAAGQVISAIASIALGFAEASVLAGKLGPFGWVAWLAAGTAALATTISTVHSLTGFADGGVVGGNTFSNDQIPIMANAGEVVLNRAQTASLAQTLQGNGQNVRVVGKIAGKDLFICAENWAKSVGKGEFVTW